MILTCYITTSNIMSALKTEVEAKFASTFFCCFHRTSNTDEQRVTEQVW